GVDASALLSDAFLRSHCFRIERNGRQPGVVGLAFEPIDRGGMPDIEGVLWVDQRTAELQHLEFTFTRHLHPIAVPRAPFGGRVEFRRLANGAWVVDGWWLRMPQLPTTVLRRLVQHAARDDASDQDALRAAHRRGMRIWEEGAELRDLAEPAAPQPRGATVSGVVYDSARGRPLADATVFVDPGGRAVRTDGAGRFRLTNLPAGRLGVGFLHPYA